MLQRDYTVFTAKDGEEALKKAEKNLPDLILLDIILPGIDGYETFVKLRKLEKVKDIPVIFITGLTESKSEEKGLELGAVDYITKPFNPVIVKLKIRHQIKIINLQRALAEAAEVAENANKAKSSFLANMSHEMRTPMNAIVGLTDLLLEAEEIESEIKDSLRKVNTAANTLMGLINDVLDISKIEAGRQELMPVQYEIASLLNDIIILNILRIEDKPIIFKLEINEDIPYSFFGDDLRVKQILNNLLSNAFKYTKEGTVTLNVDFKREDAGVWVFVDIRDTGIGIRPQDLGKLFSDYNQVNTNANREIEGTGLGLSITKKFVDLMGGEISVESEFGRGTVFHVRILQGFVTEKSIGKDIAENLRNLNYSNDKGKIKEKFVRPELNYARVLVVDDLSINLDVAAEMLCKYKMYVDCVTSGKEAVDRIFSQHPVYDAIFMDHMMPEMDGIEAAQKIRTMGTKYAQSIPIIALTANVIAGNEKMFLDNGFNAFLPKPFNIMALDAIVQMWIRDKSKERERVL
jgi:signal transduction histidine kinase